MKRFAFLLFLLLPSLARAGWNRVTGPVRLPDDPYETGQLLRAWGTDEGLFAGGPANTTMVGTGTTWKDTTLPLCNSATQKLIFNGYAALNPWTCEPDAGGATGSVSSIWGKTGAVSALTARSQDSLDAGTASSSKPCKRGTLAARPATCAEGACYHATDGKGSETYVCTATNTWTKVARDPPYIDVRDYGVVCDGSTNDIPALNTVTTAIPATGATIQFPAGTCILNSQWILTSKSNVRIRGMGVGVTTLKYPNGVSAPSYMVEFRSSNNVTIEDLTLDGNRANSVAGTVDGITWRAHSGAGPYSGFAVRRTNIKNMAGDGIMVYGTTSGTPTSASMENIDIADNVFENNYNSYDPSNPRMDIVLVSASHVAIHGNVFREGTSPPTTGTINEAIRDEPDYSTDVGGDISITGNTVEGKPLVSLGGQATINGVTITGNTVRTSAAYPRKRLIAIGSGVSNVTVSGNQLLAAALQDGHGAIIVSRTARGAVIAGNNIVVSPNTAATVYGIVDDSTAGGTEELTISGNVIRTGINGDCTASGVPYLCCSGAGAGPCPGTGDGIHIAYRQAPTITGNSINNFSASGIDLAASSNAIVTGNYVYGGTNGIKISGAMDSYVVVGNQIPRSTNVIVDTATGNSHRRVGLNSPGSVGALASWSGYDDWTLGTVSFQGSTSGATKIQASAVAGTTVATLPAETGTVCTTGSVCSGYQAGPLTGDVTTSGAAATVVDGAVAISELAGGATDAPATCASGLKGRLYFDLSLGRLCFCGNVNVAASYKWCEIVDPSTCTTGSNTSCG